LNPTADKTKETLRFQSVIINAISFPWSSFSKKGTKAPQAAGKIHTDFEKGFIMAEVMKYEDFKEEGSENAVKAAGKYRQQGRNYIVEDGDIIFFKFNTPQQPKKK